MNKEAQKLKFTELRIKGDTFESIAKQINYCRMEENESCIKH